jgi:hypothetical protein
MSDGTMNLRVGSFDDGIKQTENPTLPTGRYHFRLKSWKLKQASSGAQMIQWTLEVMEVVSGEGMGMDLIEAVAWNNTMIEGDGIGFFWQFIAALAQKNVDVSFEGEEISVEWLNSLMGLEVLADLTLGSYTNPKTGVTRPSSNFDRFISLDPVEMGQEYPDDVDA